MNSRLFISLLLCFFASLSQAIKPGQIKAHSEFYEPFRAAFNVDDIDVTSLDSISVQLATAKAYQRQGLTRSSYLDSLNFTKVKPGPENQLVVIVTSSERNIEATLDLLVTIQQEENKLTHLFSLKLDPDAIGTYIPHIPLEYSIFENADTLTEAELTVEPEMTGNSNRLNPVSMINEDDSPDQVTAEPGQRASIQVKNQSISIIANNSPLHDDYSVYQIMRAFYLLNPQAFIRGNINRLKSGSTLIVPEVAEVNAVTRAQAIFFVHSVTRNKPANRETLGQASQ